MRRRVSLFLFSLPMADQSLVVFKAAFCSFIIIFSVSRLPMWTRGSVQRALRSPGTRSHLKRLLGKHIVNAHRPPGIYYQHLLHYAFSRSVSAEKSCSVDLFINLMYSICASFCLRLPLTYNTRSGCYDSVTKAF